jgi:hypothetical protein
MIGGFTLTALKPATVQIVVTLLNLGARRKDRAAVHIRN